MRPHLRFALRVTPCSFALDSTATIANADCDGRECPGQGLDAEMRLNSPNGSSEDSISRRGAMPSPLSHRYSCVSYRPLPASARTAFSTWISIWALYDVETAEGAWHRLERKPSGSSPRNVHWSRLALMMYASNSRAPRKTQRTELYSPSPAAADFNVAWSIHNTMSLRPWVPQRTLDVASRNAVAGVDSPPRISSAPELGWSPSPKDQTQEDTLGFEPGDLLSR